MGENEKGPCTVREVDPWRFTGGFLTSFLASMIPDEATHPEIPWATAGKPLVDAKVALLTTAGLSMRGDVPFDMEKERARPTWGDPGWRALRADADSNSIEANHLHIDTGYILADINVALPLDRLRELVEDGVVGAMADTHYSVMGYQGADTSVLEGESAPAIAESMKSEGVDLALLAPV